MQPRSKTAEFTSLFILAAGVSSIGLIIPRYESGTLFLAYSSAFMGYYWACRFPPTRGVSLTFGVALRLLLFFGLPSLSDDLYRFIWDGHLLHNGISPFAELPSHYNQSGHYPPGLGKALFDRLNSPEYFSVYPPLNQAIFWIAATVGGSNWLVSAGVIRAILLLADIGGFVYLRKLLIIKNKNPNLANWYFLNPLVMLEGVGNLHFEVLVIFFLVLGLYYWHQQKSISSGITFGLAIATKLLPLIYLPALLLKSNGRKGITLCATAVGVALASFLPLLSQTFISGMGHGLGLYFQKFEFNASIYYLLREIGFWMVGYNIIGSLVPWLSFITLTAIFGFCFIGWKHGWPLSLLMLLSLTIYLLLTTTVHPWYILPLIIFGILSGYSYPIVWSLMVFVTYFGYSKDGFELSLVWIVLEYVVVLISLTIDIYRKSYA